MLKNNHTPKRCLILSKYPDLQKNITSLCCKLNLIPDVTNDRKKALECFLQYRHFLLVIDDRFLPRFPYRLVQLFKIAHSEPAVVILNFSAKNLAGFERLDGYCVKVVSSPITSEDVFRALSDANNIMAHMVRAVFIKNLFVQIGMAIPLFLGAVMVLVRCLGR